MNRCHTLKRIAAFALVSVFLGSGLGLLLTVQKGRKEEQAFRALSQRVLESESATPQEEEVSSGDGILLQYQSLYRSNSDLAGWIRIDGTRIDYPVMFTPGDVEYYLHRAFDGSSSDAGTPFLGYGCSLEPRSDNLVLYGHNMKNGTMFHDLLEYAQEDFFQEHPVIFFDTLRQTGTYQVAAAFYAEIVPGEGFRYDTFTDLSDPQQFKLFQEQILQRSLYDTGTEITCGDQLLTLSTCSYHAAQGRFVVVAKRIG